MQDMISDRVQSKFVKSLASFQRRATTHEDQNDDTSNAKFDVEYVIVTFDVAGPAYERHELVSSVSSDPAFDKNETLAWGAHYPGEYLGVTLREVDGEELSVVRMEISSFSHPYWTGKMREVDSDGKIDRFRRRFGGGKK